MQLMQRLLLTLAHLQGGLYAPSIFIGAALGSAFGLVVHAVGDPMGLPLSAPQAYALVGGCPHSAHAVLAAWSCVSLRCGGLWSGPRLRFALQPGPGCRS